MRGDGVWLSEKISAQPGRSPAMVSVVPAKSAASLSIPAIPTRSMRAPSPSMSLSVKMAPRVGNGSTPFGTFPRYQPSPIQWPPSSPTYVTSPSTPKNPNTMYVALQVGYMIKTKDGGDATWELLTKNLDCDVHTIVLHPEDSNKIFIATGGHDCRAGKAPGRALYFSSDGGENWAPMAAEFMEEYSVPLTIHPKRPNVIYSAVANGQPGQWRKRASGAEAFLIQSTDAGKSWKSSTAKFQELTRVLWKPLLLTRLTSITCTRRSKTATFSQ